MYTMYMNKIFVCYIFNFGNYLRIFFRHTYCKFTHSLKWSILGKNNFKFALNRFGKNLIQIRKLIVIFKLIIKSHISCIWSLVSYFFFFFFISFLVSIIWTLLIFIYIMFHIKHIAKFIYIGICLDRLNKTLHWFSNERIHNCW